MASQVTILAGHTLLTGYYFGPWKKTLKVNNVKNSSSGSKKVKKVQSTVRKKMAAVHLPQYLANQTKPFRHMERYDLMAVIPTLTALLLSGLNDLQYCTIFLCVFNTLF